MGKYKSLLDKVAPVLVPEYAAGMSLSGRMK